MSSEESAEDQKMILILDNDPIGSKYVCPFSTCNHLAASIIPILGHMWKFKKKNAVNKTCTGQKSPSITLYPKLFYHSKFKQHTHPIFKQEYPSYEWETIQTYINPNDDDSSPNIISLIQEFNVFITKAFIENYPNIQIPKSLKPFILDNNFEPDHLPSMLRSIKERRYHSTSPSMSSSNINGSNCAEPPYKKRKLSAIHSPESTEEQQTTLLLPSLLDITPNRASHSNSMMGHISNTRSLSFDLNQYNDNNDNHNDRNNKLSVIIPGSQSPSNIVPDTNMMNGGNIRSRKRKRRRSIGPICSACNIEINPCSAMIKCAECISDEPIIDNLCDDINDNNIHYVNVIICIQCFKIGREFLSHKRFHKYLVLRPLNNFKLQQNDNNNNNKNGNDRTNRYKLNHARWTANDEWNLLYGLRRYGLGNWGGITKIINNNKNNKNNNKQNFDYKHVESHFDYKYGDIVYVEKSEKEAIKQRKSSSVSMSYQHRIRGKKKRERDNVYNDNNNNSNNVKFTDKHKLKCGYRSKRDEFEAEWNNDAEAMIGEMYFSEYDTKQERSLKLEGLRLYNDVLKERKIRKKFIKDYGVIYTKRNRKQRNNKMDIIEQDITNNLSLFARYTKDKNRNFSEFKSLTQGLMEEKRLRDKIYKLRHYLLNGITSISKMEKIEKYVEKQQELKQERDKKLELKKKERMKRINNNNNNNLDIIDDEEEEEEEEEDDDDIIPENAEEYLNKYNGCSLDAISTYLTLIESEKNNKNKNNDYDDDDDDDINNNNKDNNNLNESDKKYIFEWNSNLRKTKDFNKLSEGEKKLCDILKIDANHFKYIKKEIAKRCHLHGLLNKNKIPQQLYIDINDIKNIKNTMTMKIGLVDPQILAKLNV